MRAGYADWEGETSSLRKLKKEREVQMFCGLWKKHHVCKKLKDTQRKVVPDMSNRLRAPPLLPQPFTRAFLPLRKMAEVSRYSKKQGTPAGGQKANRVDRTRPLPTGCV